MTRVFKVAVEVNRFQTFDPVDAGVFKRKLLDFDGRPRGAAWTPPEVEVQEKKLKPGDFLDFNRGCLITPRRVTDALRPLLEAAGELLPLTFQGKPYDLLNVTQVHDCLDPSRTVWVGNRLRIQTYAFLPDRLPDSSLFKIPDRVLTEIFVHDGPSSRPGFKAEVERLGLQGLRFDPVWSA